ncbi:hypothetical protein KRP22_013508 [Phytophthora ramorum]|uniref:HTH CENPB-type domain-containing protein n=1 Tax=Phytophthora ramorum TaxID=164328 RepID=H3H9I9_PHYRM|nr:hypothetical protein KRP22_11322 [Phytophthora ramorum]
MGRARASEDGGRRARQYKRSTPTYEFRLHVIHHSNSHGVSSALAKFYPEAKGSSLETKRKSFYLWRKRRDTIEKAGKSSSSSVLRKLRPAGSATVLSSQTESQLLRWVNSYRADGAPVSTLMLQLKAQEYAAAAGIPRGVFTGTWAWRAGFVRVRA